MRVQRYSVNGCVAIDFTGEEDRVGIFLVPKERLIIELYYGLAEELVTALRALLEKKS